MIRNHYYYNTLIFLLQVLFCFEWTFLNNVGLFCLYGNGSERTTYKIQKINAAALIITKIPIDRQTQKVYNIIVFVF